MRDWHAPSLTSSCESGLSGLDIPEIACPLLADNHSLTMRNPVNLILRVINGGFPPSTEGNPRPYGMPPSYPVLNEVGRSRGVPVD